jgi:cytochrome c-type biogenesis protein CcmH
VTRGRAIPTVLAALAFSLAPAGQAAGAQRAALTQIERQVMCVTCKIPLNVAQSPQADRERAYIQSLIDEGKDEAQVKSALVAQYGSTVLGLPADHGFGIAAYLVPLAAVLALAGVLAVLLPRWRRRSRGGTGEPTAPLPPADAARLESDLARFD